MKILYYIVKVFMHFFNCMKNLVIFLHTEHCIWIANKNVLDVIKIFDMVFLEHEQNHAMSAIFANFSIMKGNACLLKKIFSRNGLLL